jgi:hypothetical protein
MVRPHLREPLMQCARSYFSAHRKHLLGDPCKKRQRMMGLPFLITSTVFNALPLVG